MTTSKAKVEGSAIVLVGTFNPAIVQPAWLGARDLIRPEEAERCSKEGIEVISPQITSFSLDWAKIQVIPERFSAEALSAAQHVELGHLVSAIYSLLEHTPIRIMGFIWRAHYALPSEDAWHALGDSLAPKELWRQVLSSPIRGGTPGLRSLVIEGQRESSDQAEWTRIRVEPSVRVEHGIYIEVHEQFDQSEREEQAGPALMDLLRDGWEGFLRDAPRMAGRVLSWSR